MEESYSLIKDIGKYIEVLFRQWQIIVSAVLICAILAGLLTIASPKVYMARVVIASTKVASTVSFGSNIQTLSESQLMASGSGAYGLVDRKSRQGSYEQLVQNPDVAQKVLEELKDELAQAEPDNGEWDVNRLLMMVSGKMIPNTDSLEITVRYNDPQVAADIANAWGRAYVNKVNSIYSESGSSESYATVKSQAVEAKKDYDVAQAALVDFITNNQIDEISRRIGEQRTIITSLMTARNVAITTIINEQTRGQLQVVQQYYNSQAQNQLLALQRDQDSRRKIINSYIDAMVSMRQKVFDAQVDNLTTKLTNAYTNLRRSEKLLMDAQNMREQVEKGGEGAALSNSLALNLLKSQAFAANEGLGSLTIQASSTAVSQQAMIADLDGLIATLKGRKQAAEKDIQDISSQLVSNEGLQYTDQPLDVSGELAKTVLERYPDLFKTGDLAQLSLDAVEKGNPLANEVNARAKSLLELQGLEEVLNYNIIDTPIEKKISELQQNIRDLNAALSKENDKYVELTRARDLAWKTYNNLSTKEAELAVAVQTRGTEVALGAPASVPKQDLVSGVSNVMTGSVVGLILGIVIAYAIEFWWLYKDIPSHAVKIVDFNRFLKRKANTTGDA